MFFIANEWQTSQENVYKIWEVIRHLCMWTLCVKFAPLVLIKAVMVVHCSLLITLSLLLFFIVAEQLAWFNPNEEDPNIRPVNSRRFSLFSFRSVS